MRFDTRWTAPILGMALLCAALPAQAQSAPTLKVGVIGPFTGPSSDFGVLMLQGVQLATEEINAVGGYMGRHIELVVKDDQGNPDIGLKGSQELVAQGVTATLGFCNTGVAQKSLDVFQSAKLPLIIPCATGTPLTAKYPSPESYIFRTSPRDAIQAPFVVEDILRHWPQRTSRPFTLRALRWASKTCVTNSGPRKQLVPTWYLATPWGQRTLSLPMDAKT